MISSEQIQQAVERWVATVNPGKMILSGSLRAAIRDVADCRG